MIAGVTFLLFLALLIQFAAPADPYKAGVVIECIDEAELTQLKELTIRAIDEAYADQVGRLFKNWMSDSHGQPKRAQTGTSNAIAAWLDARKGAASFMPPRCTVMRTK